MKTLVNNILLRILKKSRYKGEFTTDAHNPIAFEFSKAYRLPNLALKLIKSNIESKGFGVDIHAEDFIYTYGDYIYKFNKPNTEVMYFKR